MDIGVYRCSDVSNDAIKEYIKQRKSFVLIEVESVSATVKTVEKIIENDGLKCRVFTDFRKSLGGLIALPNVALAAGVLEGGAVATAVGGVSALAVASQAAVVGAASVVGIGIHNILTWNPDYEIGKNYLTKSLSITYKK
jgi:hypothetical protein